MQHIITFDWAYLSGFDCDDIQRAAIQGEKLNLIGSAFTIDVNHCTNIPGFKIVFGEVYRKNSAFMFLYHAPFSTVNPNEAKKAALPSESLSDSK
jgi:hypothetical protein